MKEDTIGMMLKLWVTRKVQVITKLSSNQGKARSRFSRSQRRKNERQRNAQGFGKKSSRICITDKVQEEGFYYKEIYHVTFCGGRS